MWRAINLCLVLSFIAFPAFSESQATENPIPDAELSYPDFRKKIKVNQYTAEDLEALPANIADAARTAMAASDYHQMGALVFNAFTSFDTINFFMAAIEKVPQNIPILIYGTRPQIAQLRDDFGYSGDDYPNIFYLEVNYNKITKDNSYSYSEWTQDHVGLPVWDTSSGQKKLSLVTSNYRHNYDGPQDELLSIMGKKESHHHISQNMDWGNAVVHAESKTLFVVGDNQTKDDRLPPELDLRELMTLGVDRVIQLPHITEVDENGKEYKLSIGHADERMIFLSDKVVLTDIPHYKTFFEELGFDVRMLPRFEGKKNMYYSYTNSRLMNVTDEKGKLVKLAFIPTFGEFDKDPTVPDANLRVYSDTDLAALAVYKDLGYKVIPTRTPLTSAIGWGNVHCRSRALPEIEGGWLPWFKKGIAK